MLVYFRSNRHELYDRSHAREKASAAIAFWFLRECVGESSEVSIPLRHGAQHRAIVHAGWQTVDYHIYLHRVVVLRQQRVTAADDRRLVVEAVSVCDL